MLILIIILKIMKLMLIIMSNKEDVNDAFEIKFDSNNPIVKEFDIEIKMEYIDIKKSNKNVKLLLKK